MDVIAKNGRNRQDISIYVCMLFSVSRTIKNFFSLHFQKHLLILFIPMIVRSNELLCGKASRTGDPFENLHLCYGTNLTKVLKGNMNTSSELFLQFKIHTNMINFHLLALIWSVFKFVLAVTVMTGTRLICRPIFEAILKGG